MEGDENLERDFKGVWVPKEIWLNKSLTILDKAIMVEIDSLDKGDQNGCWAGNEHFAEMFGCTTRKVSDAVSKLIKMGYVKAIGNDGRHRFLRSCMKQAFQEFNNSIEPDTKEYSSLPNEIFQSASRNFLPSNTYSKSMSNIEEEERAREEKENPFGYGECETPHKDTVQMYATNNLKVMSPGNYDEFNEFLVKYGVSEDLMRYAIDVACGNGVGKWNYVASILYGWLDEGIKTVGDAKARQEAYRKRKAKPTDGRHYRFDTKTNSTLPPLGKGDEII